MIRLRVPRNHCSAKGENVGTKRGLSFNRQTDSIAVSTVANSYIDHLKCVTTGSLFHGFLWISMPCRTTHTTLSPRPHPPLFPLVSTVTEPLHTTANPFLLSFLSPPPPLFASVLAIDLLQSVKTRMWYLYHKWLLICDILTFAVNNE